MPLTTLQFQPGVVRDATGYATKGTWFDCNLVRFRLGFAETMGGWQKLSETQTTLGTVRSMHVWFNLRTERRLAMGTHRKYYVEFGSGLYDITPVIHTEALALDALAVTAGSTTLRISRFHAPVILGSFITVAGAIVPSGSALPASVFNREHEVTFVSATYFEVQLSVPSDVTDAAFGNTPIVAYQVAPGLNDQAGGTGWGAGPWNAGEWGLWSDFVPALQLRLWTQAKYCEDLVYNVRDGFLCYWQSYLGLTTRGTLLATRPGAEPTTPVVCTQALVSSRDRHVIALGASRGLPLAVTSLTSAAGTGLVITAASHNMRSEDHILITGADDPAYNGVHRITATGPNTLTFQFAGAPTPATGTFQIYDHAQDPLLIRFSDQENPGVWTPRATNTAGDLRLSGASRIIRAIETKREILVWTDSTLFSMRFLGPPFTFGIEPISKSYTLIGFNCFGVAEDTVFWMGRGAFYVYDGQVRELPCTVKSYVFDDLNTRQFDKVHAGTNSEFSEIVWFYPSRNSSENDRYVIYNYKDNAWYFGRLSRTAWIDCCPHPYPVAATTDGFLYYHEFGVDDGSTNPPSPLNCFIESGPLELGEGNQFLFVRRVIPDVTFRRSVPGAGVTFTLVAQDFPGAERGDYVAVAPVERTVVDVIDEFTHQVHVRLRTRSVRMRLASAQTGTQWQMGVPRIDVRTDGRR